MILAIFVAALAAAQPIAAAADPPRVLAMGVPPAAARPAGARSAAALVPASARGALLLDGAGAAAGLRALLDTAGRHTPMLAPQAIGTDLSSAVGVDLLQEPKEWGLAASGPRALVAGQGAVALSAPVADAKAAKRALEAWLAEAGPERPTRPSPLKGPLVAGNRAGFLAPVGGSLRLLIGSGRRAAALVSAMAHVGSRKADTPPLSRDPAFAQALARATGPAALWLRSDALLHGGVLSLDASATGLVATGLILPAQDAALLAGEAPPACAGSPLGCVRADLGSAGRAVLAAVVRDYVFRALPAGARDVFDRLTQRASAGTGKIALRVDGLDAAMLGDERESIWALRFAAGAEVPGFLLDLPATLPAGVASTATGASFQGGRPLCFEAASKNVALSAPCGPAPDLAPGGDTALEGTLDLSALDRALSKLSPLDALRGPLAAGGYGGHMLYGSLLRNAGPLTLRGRPAGAAADVELRLPLR